MNLPQVPPPGYVPASFGVPTPPPHRSTASVVGIVLAGVLLVALVASTVTFAILWGGAKGRADNASSELVTLQRADSAREQNDADNARAEKLAGDYATGSATFDYRDLTPWNNALVKGVSPELKTKLQATTGAMNQLLQPLQWVSKGTVQDTIVSSQSGPVYKVNVYVQVTSTNVQAPASREVLTLYTVTLDKSKNWQITDVGGAVTAPK